MYVHPRKQDKLKKRLYHVLKQENLEAQRTIIQSISSELDVTPLDFAAALLYVSQPHLFQPLQDQDDSKKTLPVKSPNFRNVRYHLSVGSQHKITPEQLLEVMIAESGVERKRITRLDMRDSYTLIDLPDGMPADIFQILNETMIGEHMLKIRRLKPNRKKFRESHKS